jgi:hypothetical protein
VVFERDGRVDESGVRTEAAEMKAASSHFLCQSYQSRAHLDVYHRSDTVQLHLHEKDIKKACSLCAANISIFHATNLHPPI